MKWHVFGLALFSITSIIANSPAHAAGSLTRTFVSSSGVDTNPCTIAQPCATFATAYAAVEANGIVAALDPGKYGPLTINTAVTINGNGWSAITAPASSTGITINAGSNEKVTLTGLEIDGAGAAFTGIAFNSGAMLDIIKCVVQNTVSAGISITPSGGAQVTIAQSYVSNNPASGITLSSGSGTNYVMIDHDILTDNGIGINALSGSGDLDITIANSDISHTLNYGLQTASFGSGPVSAKLINVVFEDTQGNAIYAQSTSSVTMSSVNDGHDAGGLSINGGMITSDGTNHYPSVTGGSVGTYALK
jgi:hypothetical protein